MATATESLTTSFPEDWTVADLQKHLGGIPAERIRISPPPGQATEADLIRANDRKQGICELIDHVLVEKTMGYFESQLAFLIGHFIHSFLFDHNLGIVFGEAGPLRVRADQVRMPDVSFVAWQSFPDGKPPREAVFPVPPDLAVEVLSQGNTKAEMERKLREYFDAGTKLVWYLDPQARHMRVYTSPDEVTVVDEAGHVDGGDVLPGFSMSLGELFQRAERGAPEQP